MRDVTQLTTDQLYFRDPDVEPPPRGVNMLLLNPGGVLVVGQWSNDCLGWCPKPKIPKALKEKIANECAARRGKKTEEVKK